MQRVQLERVLEGILAAKEAGFDPIKVNAVSIRGFTELEVVPLAQFARRHGLEMRFIEYMPIGADQWERDKVYFAHEILELIEREVAPLVPAEHLSTDSDHRHRTASRRRSRKNR